MLEHLIWRLNWLEAVRGTDQAASAYKEAAYAFHCVFVGLDL